MQGVSVQEKVFIDPETGEYVSGRAIYEAVSCEVVPQSRFEWLKLYPRLLPRLKDVLKSKSFDVLLHCLSLVKYGTNEFHGSRTEIATSTGIGIATINRVFEGLLAADLIRPVGGSTWMVNPLIVHGGSQAMDKMLEIKYYRLPEPTKPKRVNSNNNLYEESTLERKIQALFQKECDSDDND